MRQVEHSRPTSNTGPQPPVVKRRKLNLWLGVTGLLLLGIALGMAAAMLFTLSYVKAREY